METFLIVISIIYLIGYIPIAIMTFFGFLISPHATIFYLLYRLSWYLWNWPMAYYYMITGKHRERKQHNVYHPPKEDTKDAPRTNRS